MARSVGKVRTARLDCPESRTFPPCPVELGIGRCCRVRLSPGRPSQGSTSLGPNASSRSDRSSAAKPLLGPTALLPLPKKGEKLHRPPSAQPASLRSTPRNPPPPTLHHSSQAAHVHSKAFAPPSERHLPSRGERRGSREPPMSAERGAELLVEGHAEGHLATAPWVRTSPVPG